MVFEGTDGNILFPGGLQPVDDGGKLDAAYAQEKALDIGCVGIDEDRADSLVHGSKMKIFYYSSYHPGLSKSDDGFADGLFRCPADLLCGGFIDDEGQRRVVLRVDRPVGRQVGRG